MSILSHELVEILYNANLKHLLTLTIWCIQDNCVLFYIKPHLVMSVKSILVLSR